ncbi:MAG: ATP-binding protein [Armatimonadota bacterium]
MRILIAEDEPTNRLLLQVSVRKWGHEPVIAEDGREAWALLEGPDAPPVALLDWMMPGMDGVEICRRLRASPEPRMIYVIMVTTNARPQDIVEGLEAGADDYVTKPFDPPELRARVDVGVRMVELHRRLTERERSLAAAQARLADRARFETAVGAMSDGIVTADDRWRITYANRAAELLLNLVGEDYEGSALEQVLERFELSEDAGALRESEERTTDLQIARIGTEVTLWIDGRITRLFDDAGGLTDVILTLRDATDRMNARNRELRFMNSISHKLRTPLTVIGGTLDVMAHLPTDRLSEAWERLLPICLRQVRRLDETIGRLLKFRELSETEVAVDVEPVEVGPVIEGVERTLRDRYPDEEIEFDTAIAPDAERVAVGAEDLRLIIEELADNAIKFAESRPVEVEVSVDREADGAPRILVTDNGPGIPHEYLDRVFEGYLQIEEVTTGQIRGLGLGLRIVRQLAEAHGGDVTIRSEIGHGTTVTVTLG